MATLYYDPNARGADDGTSAGDAWQTFQKAVDNAVAGDVVLCTSLNGTVETLSANVDVDTNQGTDTSPIIFRGTNGSFTADGSLCEIDGGGAGGATNVLNITVSGNSYLIFENFDFHNSNAAVINDVSADLLQFINCKIRDSVTTDGVDATAERIFLRNCSITGNNRHGVLNLQNKSEIRQCYIADNGGAGMQTSYTRIIVVDSIIHNNGAQGLFYVNGEGHLIARNVIDGNAGNGVEINGGNNGQITLIMWNRITNNGGWGFDLDDQYCMGDYNAFYNNTSGEITNTGYYDGTNDVTLTGDGYTNRAGDDFSLTDSAEARRTEILIGATGAPTTGYITNGITPTDSGGGGGARRSRGQYFGRG